MQGIGVPRVTNGGDRNGRHRQRQSGLAHHAEVRHEPQQEVRSCKDQSRPENRRLDLQSAGPDDADEQHQNIEAGGVSIPEQATKRLSRCKNQQTVPDGL